MSTFKGFSQVELTRPKKSTFDLTHDRRTALAMGRLTPILVQEAVPSDVFRGSSEILLRLAPLLAPIYDQIKLYVHYFFVPNRLLWDEWETMITGGRLGVGIEPLNAPIPPRMDIGAVMGVEPTAFLSGGLSDHLGIPDLQEMWDPSEWNGKFLDLMPFAAYHLIVKDYYRDRNFIEDDATPYDLIPLASGTLTAGDAAEFLPTVFRNYAHDYFTSALPFTQRGEEVLMPIQMGGNAPLYVNPPTTSPTLARVAGVTEPGAITTQYLVAIDETLPTTPSALWVKGSDFDGTSTSINDFRSAMALQVWLERNAVGGSRYTESIQAHFDVKNPDGRLQRAEYIGGGLINVKISEVLSTAWSQNATDQAVPQANLGGHGVTYGNTNSFRYFCTEHGFIMGIASIMAPATYQQGIPRMFRRKTFLDYPWPTFAKLGEQPVYDYEIYVNPTNLTPDADGEEPIFGYQSRYADWKWAPTTNHADFRSSLLFWSLTRTFNDTPVLSKEFLQFDEQVANRIFAVGSYPVQFWAYIHNKVTVNRPLPYFGVPNTMGFV